MTEHGVGADEEEPPPYDQEEAELAEQAQSGMLRNSAVMASGSVLSRVTGVLRNTALGAALGTTIVGDAFVLGNSLPGIVYVLVIGGALNAVFVPQLVRRMKDDADGGKGYTDSLLSLTGVTLIVVTLIAIVAAPLIVSLYSTSGYDSNQLDLAIAFTRYCLPQIFFFGLYAMLSQILNARGSFGMPMYAPVINNLVAIATYTSFVLVVGTSIASTGQITAAQTAWLGLGTTLGIVAQALVLVPVLIRAGYRWNFTRKWRGVGLGKSGRLAGWTIALVMATQLGFVVISRLATAANLSATADGDPAGLVTYTNAYLVFMIPHGVVTVSIVTAQLPHLSRQVHAGLTREAGAAIGHTLRLVATVITPLALALIIGAQSISELMFRYGGLTVEMASQIGTVTAIFMIGLLPFTLYFVLQRGWYAREDTRSPFFFSLLTNGLLVVLAVLLFRIATPGAAQVNALALAYAISCWVTFVAAWPVLVRAYGSLDTLRTLITFARIVAAAAISGGVTWALTRLVPALDFQPGQSRGSALVDLTVTSLAIMSVFVGAAWALRVGEMQELLAWVRAAARRGRR